ncbi:SRPBCC domain-containing protein [Curvivirga sp.]|uniref:SRPBCC domain-containing protein n=1 Tax=Curvivirga sp. TaxID=2856848 RepID=UPI003B59EB02
MSTENYSKSIMVNATTNEAYRALTRGYSQWWTSCEGAYGKLGDRITFKFPPQVSYWTFEARQLVPDQYVELECVEAHHIILDKPESSKTEWLGTTLRFKIEAIEDQVRVELTHDGLTPQKDCYEVCEAGWDHFFLNSLQKYLNTGTGEPHKFS